MHLVTIALFSILAAGLSALVTANTRRYVLKKNILDVPNERSSHTIPTPRGGGIAVAGVISIATLIWVPFDLLPMTWAIAIIGALPISLIGWIDDAKGLSAKSRIAVQALAAAAVLYSLTQVAGLTLDYVHLGFFTLHGLFLTVPFFFFFILWMTNLYNFMDGIDGILGLQATTVSIASVALIMEYVAIVTPSVLGFSLIAAANVGFLFFNWPPAKIFMGDVGSAFLGFALAAATIVTAAQGEAYWPSLLILHAAFIGDATWTLVRRIARKQKPHQAHRSHTYQKATQRNWPHLYVTSAYGLFNLCWLFPIALLAQKQIVPAWVAMSAGYAPVFLSAYYFRAGTD